MKTDPIGEALEEAAAFFVILILFFACFVWVLIVLVECFELGKLCSLAIVEVVLPLLSTAYFVLFNSM